MTLPLELRALPTLALYRQVHIQFNLIYKTKYREIKIDANQKPKPRSAWKWEWDLGMG
jgi:hypothetical protein